MFWGRPGGLLEASWGVLEAGPGVLEAGLGVLEAGQTERLGGLLGCLGFSLEGSGVVVSFKRLETSKILFFNGISGPGQQSCGPDQQF